VAAWRAILTIGLAGLFLYIVGALAPGCDLVRFLESERARLVVGDLRKHVTSDGTQLDPVETDALEHLCEAAAQAYVMVELRRYSQPAAALNPVAALESPLST
jgi:hypothetical protein